MIVLLLNEAGDKVLPIWIGQFEASSIVMGALNFETPRPLTYDFISNLLSTSGASLEEVRIESLKGLTFYGVAKLRVGGQVKEVEARPSDVLALVAHTGGPIYVAEDVMAQAGLPVKDGIPMPEDIHAAGEVPRPTGKGMEAILKEMQETVFNKYLSKGRS